MTEEKELHEEAAPEGPEPANPAALSLAFGRIKKGQSAVDAEATAKAQFDKAVSLTPTSADRQQLNDSLKQVAKPSAAI